MDSVLAGMRVVESSAFVAAPIAGMTLAQMGADVIRFDPIGGGLDYGRWPITVEGRSLYWAGLNKGKRSIALDLRSSPGREIAHGLIGAPGPGGGIFLTNFPLRGWLAVDVLGESREDLIVVAIKGNRDGSSEVDYTVNAATGFPLITGQGNGPVNHVLPAWDCMTGLTAVTGLLAAERLRSLTGQGKVVEVALSDVAFATLGALGFIADVEINEVDRPAYGNDLYGTYGRDFSTSDGRRVMVVAVTERQWTGLVEATETAPQIAALEERHGIDLRLEGARFEHRREIGELIETWCSARTLAEVAAAFDKQRVGWGPYQSVAEAIAVDERVSESNPMFSRIEHPGIGALLTPGSPLEVDGDSPGPTGRAPQLGEHTDEILAGLLGMSETEIGRLHDEGVVA